MPECESCSSISLPDLPTLPPCTVADYGDDMLQTLLCGDQHWADYSRLAHDRTYEALTFSSASCVLCGLVRNSVDNFITVRREIEPEYVLSFNSLIRLAQRKDLIPGFIVLLLSVKKTYVIGAVGLCTEDGSSNASLVKGRPVEPDAGSPVTLKRAANWVEHCVERHENCAANTSVRLPLRVLDLGCPSPSRVRLLEPNGAKGSYAALSYCWGRKGQLTTTTKTIVERLNGIHLVELPKTFQDAVLVTRLLGIRYLWIDALCICQDDREDWARESSKMGSYYSEAYVTIAADAAEHSWAGCFVSREARVHIQVNINLGDGSRRSLLAFRSSPRWAIHEGERLMLKNHPLDDRGWTLQERALSRRILHFCKDQIYFECDEHFLSEDGYCHIGRWQSLDAEPPLQDDHSHRSYVHSRHNLWNALLNNYSGRRLTKRCDKLPALSGLARVFQNRLQADYVAGLWSDTLVEDLLWTTHPSPEPISSIDSQPYFAPSWSWASIERGVRVANRASIDAIDDKIATIVDYGVELKTPDPFGEVAEGWIKIKAPLIPLTLNDESEQAVDTEPNRVRLQSRLKSRMKRRYGLVSTFIFDRKPQPEDQQRRWVKPPKLFAMVLSLSQRASKRSSQGQKIDDGYQSLIVAPTPEVAGSPRMSRLGYIELYSSAIGEQDLASLQDSTKFSTVILV
ncbi:MAG: hypothetical protein Q9227_002113 [Pyrenula ochraceoflavens]